MVHRFWDAVAGNDPGFTRATRAHRKMEVWRPSLQRVQGRALALNASSKAAVPAPTG
jgi:hypothetical protein